MRRRLPAVRITTIRKGAATTPLMTAIRMSSLIGLTCSRLSAVVFGAILALLGMTGHAVRGRRHYY
jgi:hypothetical protein